MNGKQIFISYSRKNREFALKLYEDLLWDGHLVWIDKKLKEGEVDYDRQLKILKHRLGPTIPIQDQLESMLIGYKTTGRLLTEVELKLIEKHEKTLVWPEGKEDLARELIDKSKRALVKFWKRYTDLERDYLLAQREMARLNKEDEQKKRQFRFVLGYAFVFIGFLVIALLVFMAAYFLKYLPSPTRSLSIISAPLRFHSPQSGRSGGAGVG